MTSATRARPLRADIQGLRFVAVLLVVVYHVWLDRVSGGVDIFLALSAYFLTASFARKLDEGRPLALVGYWTRTFARIVPLATLTIVAVVATAQWLLPIAIWPDVQQQAIASALYLQNWWLAANDVNYYGGAPIPLQHFWSLSIQGTVFLAWPLIFAAVALLVRYRPQLSGRRLLGWVFGAIFVASLAWSVWITATDQAFAYFDTRARLWEFALGSLLALFAGRAGALGVPGARWRTVAGWAALAAVLLVGVVVNVRNAFPGWIALLPLSAAAVLVLVGDDPGRRGVGRLLGHPWLAGLGNASYALYLVHWPILIGYVVASESSQPDLLAGGVIIAVSLLLAVALHRLIEVPLRRRTASWRPWRDAVLVGLCIALVLGTVTGWRQLLSAQAERAKVEQQAQAEQARQYALAQHPGARVLDPSFRAPTPTVPPIPTIADIPYQWALAGPACPAAWSLPARAQQQCQGADRSEPRRRGRRRGDLGVRTAADRARGRHPGAAGRQLARAAVGHRDPRDRPGTRLAGAADLRTELLPGAARRPRQRVRKVRGLLAGRLRRDRAARPRPVDHPRHPVVVGRRRGARSRAGHAAGAPAAGTRRAGDA